MARRRTPSESSASSVVEVAIDKHEMLSGGPEHHQQQGSIDESILVNWKFEYFSSGASLMYVLVLAVQVSMCFPRSDSCSEDAWEMLSVISAGFLFLFVLENILCAIIFRWAYLSHIPSIVELILTIVALGIDTYISCALASGVIIHSTVVISCTFIKMFLIMFRLHRANETYFSRRENATSNVYSADRVLELFKSIRQQHKLSDEELHEMNKAMFWLVSKRFYSTSHSINERSPSGIEDLDKETAHWLLSEFSGQIMPKPRRSSSLESVMDDEMDSLYFDEEEEELELAGVPIKAQQFVLAPCMKPFAPDVGIELEDLRKIQQHVLYETSCTKWKSDDKPLHVRSLTSALPIITTEDDSEDQSRVFHLQWSDHQVNEFNSKIDDWNFDVFDANEFSGGRPLSMITSAVFRKHNLFELITDLEESTVLSFVTSIENGYHIKNPYHNRIHAADVVQTLHYLLTCNELHHLLAPADILCAIVAAAIHDYQHPGITNSFLVATGDNLALRYNDRAVLEHMHVSAAFSMMKRQRSNCDVLKALGGRSAYIEGRESVILMVLGTDMSHHFEGLVAFRNEVLNFKPKNDTQNYPLNVRRVLLATSLHCADVSNPAKKSKLCQQWALLVQEEFFRQGDQERKSGLPVSMFMDRNKPSFNKCQSGFIKMIVQPLFELYCEFVISLKPQVDQCLSVNLTHWESKQNEDEPPRSRSSTLGQKRSFARSVSDMTSKLLNSAQNS